MGMNSGIHDAFNLAEKLTKILHREAGEDVLDRYERQRRHVALQHTQAQTIRNKRLLAEKDPAVRKRNHDELRRTAEDPKLARAFLLRSSLIESLREAARTEQAAIRSAAVVAGRTLAVTGVALALLTSQLSANVAHAQSADARWPERPIRFIVPFTAGSSSDTVARLVAQKLAERFGQ